MNLIQKLFAPQIQQAAQELAAQQVGNLYNRNVYSFLGDGQPIFLNDTPDTYIKEGYMASGAVYECVDLIIKKLCACPVVIYEVKDEQKLKKYNNLLQSDSIQNKALALQMKSQVMEEVSPKAIQDLLNQPNDKQDFTSFLEMMAGYYLLNGNSYVYLNSSDPGKNPWNEMYVLPSSEVKIISGGMMEPVRGYEVSYLKHEIPGNQVAHLKTFNPYYSVTGSQLYGLSPLQAYLRTLSRIKAGDKEINKQLNNGGAYGILAPKNTADTFTPEQKQALREQLVDAKNSKDEVSRILPSAVALEWMQIGLPYGDMKLLDTLQASDEDIYRAYHIPLQFRSTDGSTFNNQAAAGKQLIYNAVAPIGKKISDTLTQAICTPVEKKSGKKYMITLDTSSLPEMSEDMGKIAEWLDKSWDLTPNEKREVKGWGKLKTPGMDTIWIPGTFRPIEDAAISPDTFSNAFNEAE